MRARLAAACREDESGRTPCIDVQETDTVRAQFQAGHALIMSNIYSRLVTDEDHQTEALVDLLERVLENSAELFRDFVAQVLLGNATDEEERKNYALDLFRVVLCSGRREG